MQINITNKDIENVAQIHAEHISSIIQNQFPENEITPKFDVENARFLKGWKIDFSKLTNQTKIKINILQKVQKNLHNSLKNIVSKYNNPQVKSEALFVELNSVEMAYQTVQQLGESEKNPEVENIGKVGAQCAALALEIAMMSDKLPEIILSEMSLASPYALLAEPSLKIIQACLSHQDDFVQLQTIKHKINSLNESINKEQYPDIKASLESMQSLLDSVKNNQAESVPQQLTEMLSAISEYIQMEANDSNHAAIVKSLVDLNTFLKNADNLKDARNFANLPNTNILMQSIDAYVQARLHMGAEKSNKMDPNYKRHAEMKQIISHAMGLMEQLKDQEPALLNNLLQEYRDTYQAMIDAIKPAAIHKLHANQIPGYEDTLEPLDYVNVPWPNDMTSTVPGHNPVQFQKIIHDMSLQQGLMIPRFIKKNLDVALGQITAEYTPAVTPSTAKSERQGNWQMKHWIQAGTTSFDVSIYYVLNEHKYTLYQTTGAFSENKINEKVVGTDIATRTPLTDNIVWPTQIVSLNPDYASLPADRFVNAIKAQAGLMIPGGVKKALEKGNGKLIAQYMPDFTQATVSSVRENDFSQKYSVTPRSILYKLFLQYEINGLQQKLFETTGVHAENKSNEKSHPITIASTEALGGDITWPTQLISCTEGYSALDSMRAIQAVQRTAAISIPGIIKSALKAGVGKINAYYTPVFTAARENCVDVGHWTNHNNVIGRTAGYQIVFQYEVEGHHHALYTLSASYKEPDTHVDHFRCKPKHGGQCQRNYQYVNEANAKNAQKVAFIANAWAGSPLSAVTNHSASALPTALHSAIVNNATWRNHVWKMAQHQNDAVAIALNAGRVNFVHGAWLSTGLKAITDHSATPLHSLVQTAINTAYWDHPSWNTIKQEYDAAAVTHSTELANGVERCWHAQVGLQPLVLRYNNAIPEPMKSEMVSLLMNAAQSWTAIVNQVMSDPTIFTDNIQKLSKIKTMLLRYAEFLRSPLTNNFEQLWTGEDFINSSIGYQNQQPHLNSLHVDSNNHRNKTLENLLYCLALLDGIQHHEKFLEHNEISRISESLKVDETIIYDHKNVVCDMSKMLGQGSFGQVFRARDTQTKLDLAIKFPYGSKLSDNGELKVLTHLGQVEHPCEFLVRIFGVIQLNGRNGFVMEYVSHGTLDEHLHHEDGEQLDPSTRLMISKEVIAGLFYLHQHQNRIIHGDLKTQNIFLTEDNHAKIGDYGLSQIAATTQRMSTKPKPTRSTKIHAGTLAYCAPELIEDERRRPDLRSDIYSLGVVLWEIATCQLPFYLTDGSDKAINRFWDKVFENKQTVDHFPLPTAQPSDSDAVKQLCKFSAPAIELCRARDPDVRPSAEQLYVRSNSLK